MSLCYDKIRTTIYPIKNIHKSFNFLLKQLTLLFIVGINNFDQN